jgi:hypothetical protein
MAESQSLDDQAFNSDHPLLGSVSAIQPPGIWRSLLFDQESAMVMVSIPGYVSIESLPETEQRHVMKGSSDEDLAPLEIVQRSREHYGEHLSCTGHPVSLTGAIFKFVICDT